MAQTGYTPIQLYRTTTSGAAPNAANLQQGELAININDADMALYAENQSGTVKRLMNNPAGLKYPTTDGTANQIIKTDGAGNLTFVTPSSSGGTVTSVAMTVPTFLSVTGSPITGAGTLAVTLSGTALPVANGGTGVTSSTGSGNVVLSTSPTLVTPALDTPASGNLSNCTNAIAYKLKSSTTDIAISSATAPTTGQVLTATDSTTATWQSPASSISSVVRSAKTSAYTVVAGDKGTLIEVTSGTFTLSLTAAATLGSGWWCYVSNIGTGLITIDPNSSETITVNGTALSTWVQWTTEIGILQCDGTGFNYYQMQKGYTQQTVSSNVSSLIFSSGIVGRKSIRLNVQQANFASASSMQLRVDSGGPVWMKRNGLEGVGSGYIAAYDNTFYLYGGTPSTGNASDFFSANIDFSASINGVTVSGGWSGKSTGSEKGYFTGIGYFTTSNFNEIGIFISSGSPLLSAGTFTLTEL